MYLSQVSPWWAPLGGGHPSVGGTRGAGWRRGPGRPRRRPLAFGGSAASARHSLSGAGTVGSGAAPAPKGHGGLGSCWVCPSPRPCNTCWRLGHPGEPGIPTGTAFLPINPHGVSVRTSKPTAWPWFTGGKTEALRQDGMDFPVGNWCLSLCPLRRHQVTSSGALRTCKRPHGLSLPCAHFPSPAVLPGRLTPQPEGKGRQPGQARADPTSMRLGAEAS